MNWQYNPPFRNLFFWCTLLCAIIALVCLWWLPKDQIFIALNHQHSWFGDLFFKYYTHVGDGIFAIFLVLMLFAFGKRKLPLLIILSFLVSGLFVQIIKRIEQRPRPGLYFEKTAFVHAVDGSLHKGRNSFPSGHATTAFATASLLALATQRKRLQFIYFFAALLAGYSRIYLGQHFFEDVLAGMILGTCCSIGIAYLFRKKELD